MDILPKNGEIATEMSRSLLYFKTECMPKEISQVLTQAGKARGFIGMPSHFRRVALVEMVGETPHLDCKFPGGGENQGHGCRDAAVTVYQLLQNGQCKCGCFARPCNSTKPSDHLSHGRTCFACILESGQGLESTQGGHQTGKLTFWQLIHAEL